MNRFDAWYGACHRARLQRPCRGAERMLSCCHCSNVLGFGAAAIAMGIFLRSLDTLLFNNEDRRVARAEQERMKLAVVEV